MSIFSHSVYDNIRTRVIVLHNGHLLLLEPHEPGAGWQLTGGGLERDESLTECAEREVFEEAGLHVKATRVAFLREFVVPKYCIVPDGGDKIGFGLEVFLYATPIETAVLPKLEHRIAQRPYWIPLAQVPALPLWPKELKTLARQLASGYQPRGVPSFISDLESPDAPAPEVDFA
jgi:8-oxo-dGTP pyrophosphatase MutT (NUDIX family)